MNRNITIILVVFAIGYFGILAGITINDTSIPETVEVPVNYEYVFAEETLGISDKIEATLNG